MESESKIEKFWTGFNIFNNKQSIGAGWVARFKGYIPSFTDMAVKTSALQVALWASGGTIHIIHFNFIIPLWINWGSIFVFLLIKFYWVIIFNLIVAKIGMKKGLLKIDQDIGCKNEEISPTQRELFETVNNIAQQIGAESKITKL